MPLESSTSEMPGARTLSLVEIYVNFFADISLFGYFSSRIARFPGFSLVFQLRRLCFGITIPSLILFIFRATAENLSNFYVSSQLQPPQWVTSRLFGNLRVLPKVGVVFRGQENRR
jgi:hypothetical protein